MKTTLFKTIINEILSEMFAEALDLNTIQPGAKLTITFQDNKVELKKVKDKFKVVDALNKERIMPDDIIQFVNSEIAMGTSPKCFVYRKNKIGKYLKTNFVHEFSSIKQIEVN